MLKIYISPSCISSKKVLEFFNKHEIPYIKRNIQYNPLSREEIKELLKQAPNGVNDIISKRSKHIKTYNIKVDELSVDEVIDLLQETPMVLKRPIILEQEKKRIQIGYNEEEIELFLRGRKNSWEAFFETEENESENEIEEK